jgi:Raf kinase inhibitor-like YbhB/YbcL family protein
MKGMVDSKISRKYYFGKRASARSPQALFFLLSLLCCSENFSAGLAQTAKLSLSSTALSDGTAVPKKYTGEGEDSSPPLAWSRGPSGTKSYALSCEDPDAPGGTWWHWMVYNISADTTQLESGLAKTASLEHGIMQGRNDFRKTGYNGPLPPPGKLHHYEFKIRALDTMLNLAPNAGKAQFTGALRGHVLAEGQLTCTYKR